MPYNELIELDDDAEMIDLGVASVETEGSSSGSEDELTSPVTYYNPGAH